MKERFAALINNPLTNVWHISFILPAFPKETPKLAELGIAKNLQLLIHNNKKKSLV